MDGKLKIWIAHRMICILSVMSFTALCLPIHIGGPLKIDEFLYFLSIVQYFLFHLCLITSALTM